MILNDRDQISKVIDHLFRHQAGRLTATLTRIFGAKHIDLVESIVQESFLKACQQWPYKGIPDSPVAWLTTVAKNQILDNIRVEKKFQRGVAEGLINALTQSDDIEIQLNDNEPKWIDDLLGMMFLCCSPTLSHKSQICLTLKCVSGFTVKEIASAFLSNEEATKRLITRAKRQLIEEDVSLKFPNPLELPDRLDSILEVIYLIFNEGYSASSGNKLVKQDLCDEAIRLAQFLLHDSFDAGPKRPKIKAILALMLLHSAKNEARTDENGGMVLLQDQDRSKWDSKKLSLGMHWLNESIDGDELSFYHVEAQLVALHTSSSDYENADWLKILEMYDLLYQLKPNPVVKLNRVVALGMVIGHEEALPELLQLTEDKTLRVYQYLYAAIADFYKKSGNNDEAAKFFRKAISAARIDSDKRFLEEKLHDCFFIS